LSVAKLDPRLGQACGFVAEVGVGQGMGLGQARRAD
jgi:hypothetical protein